VARHAAGQPHACAEDCALRIPARSCVCVRARARALVPFRLVLALSVCKANGVWGLGFGVQGLGCGACTCKRVRACLTLLPVDCVWWPTHACATVGAFVCPGKEPLRTRRAPRHRPRSAAGNQSYNSYQSYLKYGSFKNKIPFL